MKRAKRPPLHPNCRSTLIPVVDLIDPETGEKIEETAERPAQNADGTYSQVPAKTTFRDYFETQPESFQRAWLGEKRFELWKAGQLKFDDLVKPAATYRATTADLQKGAENATFNAEKRPETPESLQKTQENAPNLQKADASALAPWEGPDELARKDAPPKIDAASLPALDGSPKQVAWVRDRIRADQLDAFNAVDLPQHLRRYVEPIRSKPGPNETAENAERRNLNALIRAEIDKRGETEVLAELEAATREIAAEMFAETSCREWIDGRFGPGVLHRATTEALRRVATTGSGAKPKPAFDLPPLDLPELVLSRLEGTPRQISWAEDLRRRAVRDWTEERANETARDTLRRLRDYESAFAEENRSDLEAAIKAVGGDDAAELILGREIYLEARQSLEEFRKARDWIDLKTSGKTLYDLPKFVVFGPEPNAPKNAAEILRRYADEAKAVEGPSIREKLENLKEAGLKNRRQGFDEIFPLDDHNSENRVKMRQKYPTKAGKIRASKDSNAPFLSPDAEKSLNAGLDFVGRALDNIVGEDFKNRGFWKTHFRAYCEGTGRYCSDGSIVLRDNVQKTIGENVAHEFAHALERNAPGLLSRLQALYIDLTTEESGERTPLTCENPDAPTDERRYFRALAQQHKDLNIPAYALRTYAKQQAEPATELLSMWLQKIFENPRKFTRDYHQYNKEILRVLKEWRESL